MTTIELDSRLETATEEAALAAIGFLEDDRADVRRAARAALADPERLAAIEAMAERLRGRIGLAAPDAAESEDVPPLDPATAEDDWFGMGVTSMLALLAVADDVRAFHASRGITAEISDASLSDLGQQVGVHRRTFGGFGLHTQQWVARTSFSGSLYWLGRLQFELVRQDGTWVLSTHIPESGPLTPESVADSFARASAFFPEHFAEYPTTRFTCSSWLLDPQLAEVLKPESNMVRFQQLWTLDHTTGEANADAIFFVFRRRGEVDRSQLPRDTTLQRAILDRIDAGGHWSGWNGWIDQASLR